MNARNLVGATLGDYEIEKLLGKGGMAIVYKARQKSLNREVALKILSPVLGAQNSFVRRFQREARAMAKLSHPGIVRVFEIGEAEGYHFFSMEYVDGTTLAHLLEEKRRFSEQEAARIATRVARAIREAHRNRIIHRDLKPSNIMIDSTGQVKVMDFGLAKITSEITRLTESGTLLGTAAYMSPEQCRGDKLDLRTDIYSLGVVFYEMLTGRTPFIARNNVAMVHKIIYDVPPKIININPDVSDRTATVIARTMAKDRALRYESMSQFLKELGQSRVEPVRKKESAPASVPLDEPATRKTRASANRIPLAVAGCLILLVFGVALLRGLPRSAEQPPEPKPEPVSSEENPPAGSLVETEKEPPKAVELQVREAPENMVYVPEGDFTMGSSDDLSDEQPVRRVHLDAYFIDKYEVSNAEYKEFVDAMSHPAPFFEASWAEAFNWRGGTYPEGTGNCPVVLVTWEDAKAYATWAGKRLPREAEWEKAARGFDGRKWPWGDEWMAGKSLLAGSHVNAPQPVNMSNEDISPFGCCNMAGNVKEWTSDWYSRSYYRTAPFNNPTGPPEGQLKVVRGGAWTSPSQEARTSYRDRFEPATKSVVLGFRCAKSIDE